MCKGYKWRVWYYRQLSNPRPVEWFETLTEARESVRRNGLAGMSPDYSGMLAEAVPICDVPPMRTPRRAEPHYFMSKSGRIVETL